MKVTYKFIFSDENDVVRSFYQEVDSSMSIDANKMFDLFKAHLTIMGVTGHPLHAVSQSSKFPDFCFEETSETCDNGCRNRPHKYPENKKPEPEKMIWARISDENENRTAWIPALVSGGKIYSAIGEINNPDSEEDTREFTDCPIPGYQISHTKITNKLKTGFCVVTCLIKPKDTKIRPFLYRKEFHVPSEKEPIEYLKSLCSQFVIGDYDISIVHYQPISPLSGETLYSDVKCPDSEYNLIMKKYLRSEYFLVNYSYECNGTEIAATCLIPKPIFGFRKSYESISYVEEKLAKRVNYQMIISIHEYESILKNWAVLL